MKRVCLALSIVVVAVLLLLLGAGGSGAAPANEPGPDARPTATAISPLPEPNRQSVIPESPEIPPLPDLVVESIQVIPSTPVLGEPAIIQVVIHNQSPYDIPDPTNNFWTDVYVDPGVVPIQLHQKGIDAWDCQATWVPAGGRHTLETEYTFDDVRSFSLWAQVDTDGHVTEANEHNNVTGPVSVQVRSRHMAVHETHQDFQLGLASTLDASHSEGVLRPGLFFEPWQEPPAVPIENSIYRPDFKIDDAPDSPAEPTTWNQVKPALASNGPEIFAVWEDGRNGGVFNRDIYFARSLDGGESWDEFPTDGVNSFPVNQDDPSQPANQVSPDITYDPISGRLYVVWQDERAHPGQESFDIYLAYSDDLGANWTEVGPINDDTGVSTQLNPAVTVGKADGETENHVYVVWQDRRNGNDDIYLARSDDGGVNWSPNYFVTDDPDMTLQNQANPAVSIENAFGIVIVAWEDWRDPLHPEIYVMWSLDQGQTFGVDVPVTIVPPEFRTTYRLAPDLVAHTTVEWVERIDPFTGLPYWVLEPLAAIHVAWQEGLQEASDIYYAFTTYDFTRPEACPVPYDFCFQEPMLVSGYELPSDYVRRPDEAPPWPLEPSWQGQVSIDLVPDNVLWTNCLLESTQVYSKGVVIAWSDARSYDEWRHEIHLRRIASPGGSPKSYVACERPRDVGMVNSNAKLHIFRDDLIQYETFKPAAARQSNPYVLVDAIRETVYIAWDDDRWDDPFQVGTVRNRDIFGGRMEVTTTGAYISPVIHARTDDPKWYVLSWWAASDHNTDILLQTRFGTTIYPPQEDVAANGWTRWTGNPSATYAEPPFLGCAAGEGCYYDAPGRHIVGPNGDDWFGPTSPGVYPYMQYKVIMSGTSRWTALGQVIVHYKGPEAVYLPLLLSE